VGGECEWEKECVEAALTGADVGISREIFNERRGKAEKLVEQKPCSENPSIFKSHLYFKKS
jgi:hypothetical protein